MQTFFCSIVKLVRFQRTFYKTDQATGKPIVQVADMVKYVRKEFFCTTWDDSTGQLVTAIKTHLDADRALSLNSEYLWIDVYAVNLGEKITDQTPHSVWRIEADFDTNVSFSQIAIEVKTAFFEPKGSDNLVYKTDCWAFPVRSAGHNICEMVAENVNPYLFAYVAQPMELGPLRRHYYPAAFRSTDYFDDGKGNFTVNGEGKFATVKWPLFLERFNTQIFFQSNYRFDKDGTIVEGKWPAAYPVLRKAVFNHAQSKRQRDEHEVLSGWNGAEKEIFRVIQMWYDVEVEKASWDGQIKPTTVLPVQKLQEFVAALLGFIGVHITTRGNVLLLDHPRETSYRTCDIDLNSTSQTPVYLYRHLRNYADWYQATELFVHGYPGEFLFEDFKGQKLAYVQFPGGGDAGDPTALQVTQEWFNYTSDKLKKLAFYYNQWYENALRMLNILCHYVREGSLVTHESAKRHSHTSKFDDLRGRKELATWQALGLPTVSNPLPPHTFPDPNAEQIERAPYAATNYYRPPLLNPRTAPGDNESKDVAISPLTYDNRQLNIDDYDKEERKRNEPIEDEIEEYTRWRRSGYITPKKFYRWDNSITPNPSQGLIQDAANSIYNYFSTDEGKLAAANGADTLSNLARAGAPAAGDPLARTAGGILAKNTMAGAGGPAETLAYHATTEGVTATEAAGAAEATEWAGVAGNGVHYTYAETMAMSDAEFAELVTTTGSFDFY